jgi:hypothetical protein
MNKAGVGRLLVASLHQGIADLMPSRLDFYENWLNPVGMRNGKIGLAPLAAVLSFLRQEGESYGLVTERAGEYAAQWTFDALSPIQRLLIRHMPLRFRARAAMHVVKRVVRYSYTGSRAALKLRKGQGTVTMRGSLFCVVREPLNQPLCGYYAAALLQAFKLASVNAKVQLTSCQGTGSPTCVMTVSVVPDQK